MRNSSRLLLFTSLLVVFLILTTPSISAIEYSVTEKVNKEFYLHRVKNFLSSGRLINIIALIEMILAVILADIFAFIYIMIWINFILPHISENPALIGYSFLLGVFIPLGIIYGFCRIIQHQLGWSNDFTKRVAYLLSKIAGILGIIISIILYLIVCTQLIQYDKMFPRIDRSHLKTKKVFLSYPICS